MTTNNPIDSGEVAAAGLTWLLETFVSPFVAKIKDKFKDKQERDRWQFAVEAYCRRLYSYYGVIRVLGKGDDIALDSVFTDVYILDEITARRRHSVEELMARGIHRFSLNEEPAQRRNGIGLVNQGENLYIIGKPGAGKTTFLKYVAVRAVQGRLTNPRLPIFVSLHEMATSSPDGELPEPLEFIVKQVEECHFPRAHAFVEDLLEHGRALILFDGLDEVRQEGDKRRRLIQMLKSFTRQYAESQFLVTCRIAASDYTFQGFRDVEIADFTNAQVGAYAQKWFGDRPDQCKKFMYELNKPEHSGLRELCNIPLLLSLLCLYFSDTTKFPARRAELYELALDSLLRKLDTEQGKVRDEIYRGLSHKRKQQLFSHLAAPRFERGEYYFTTEDLATDITVYLGNLPDAPPNPLDIDGESVLRAIEAQHGILVERATNVHSFSHLTFQEYFTAYYIANNEARHTVQWLVQRHLTDTRWQEVVLLTASLLDEGDDFLCDVQLATWNLIASQAHLVEAVRWAEMMASRTELAPDKQLVARLAYLALTLDRSRYLARSFARARALALARSLALDLSYEFALVRDREMREANAFVRFRAREIQEQKVFVLDLPLAFDLANSLDDQVAIDYGLYYAWGIAEYFAQLDLRKLPQERIAYVNSFPQILDLCRQGRDITLIHALEAISVPSDSASNDAWHAHAEEIKSVLVTHRGFRFDWQWTREDRDLLNDYLYANEMVVRCLSLAYASNRQVVLKQVLTDPKKWSDH